MGCALWVSKKGTLFDELLPILETIGNCKIRWNFAPKIDQKTGKEWSGGDGATGIWKRHRYGAAVHFLAPTGQFKRLLLGATDPGTLTPEWFGL